MNSQAQALEQTTLSSWLTRDQSFWETSVRPSHIGQLLLGISTLSKCVPYRIPPVHAQDRAMLLAYAPEQQPERHHAEHKP